LPAGQVEGQTVACGYLVVPERHAQPDGRTIRLAVARFASRQRDPVADPLVYLAGGPGESVQRLIGMFTGALAAAFTADRDFIAFDQRGVGRSQPALDCPELAAQYLEDAARALGAREEGDHTVAAARRCRDRLAAQGVDLAAYTTAESAADVDALRAALGYRQVNLLGVSYGAT